MELYILLELPLEQFYHAQRTCVFSDGRYRGCASPLMKSISLQFKFISCCEIFFIILKTVCDQHNIIIDLFR